MDLLKFEQAAQKALSKKRYEHTLAVARLSGELAEVYGADVTDGSVENYDLDWPEPVQPSES